MIAKKRDIRVEKIMSTQKKKLKLAVVADDDDDCFSHILTTPACINEITIPIFSIRQKSRQCAEVYLKVIEVITTTV